MGERGAAQVGVEQHAGGIDDGLEELAGSLPGQLGCSGQDVRSLGRSARFGDGLTGDVDE